MTEWMQSWFKDIFANDVFEKIAGILKLNPSEGELSAAWNGAEVVYNNVMVPIALGLMIIWFLVALMEKSSSEQVTIEQFLLLFVKLIAAKFIIDNGFQIFAQLWGLGISIIDEVGGAFADEDVLTFNYKDLWFNLTGVPWGDKLPLMTSLGLLCQLLIPWLASKIMIACVYFICYSRLLEMLVRMLATPIAVSDFITEGLHGSGWRYIKNFLAICLQGMIIIAIGQLYPLVMAGVLSTSGSFWTVVLKYLAFSFAAIALMFKSLSLSKELVGTA